MPVCAPAAAQSHREKEQREHCWADACVARPVSRREIERTEAAQRALEKEWKKLRDAHCWDETDVREWSEVAAGARAEGVKAHTGRISEICVEKGSELPLGNPDRTSSRAIT